MDNKQFMFPHSELPISNLSRVFDDTTNSYKYFWFKAIIDNVRYSRSPEIKLNDIFIDMIASASYPSKYFRLNFGSQDKMSHYISMLAPSFSSRVELSISEVRDIIKKAPPKIFNSVVGQLQKYVPYRFLTPFFSIKLRGLVDNDKSSKIKELSAKEHIDCCPYHFNDVNDKLILHQKWLDYFIVNNTILLDFCMWNLLKYLQKRNPNTPNLCAKLFPPSNRDLNIAHNYWDIILSCDQNIKCIYSGKNIDKETYGIDHFIPWSFTAHDLLWNLTPTTKEMNSSKSDILPNLEKYLTPFINLQYKSIKLFTSSKGASKVLEDYQLLTKLPTIKDLVNLSEDVFSEFLRNEINAQNAIAINMGFQENWECASL
jgi:hypothetical protein